MEVGWNDGLRGRESESESESERVCAEGREPRGSPEDVTATRKRTHLDHSSNLDNEQTSRRRTLSFHLPPSYRPYTHAIHGDSEQRQPPLAVPAPRSSATPRLKGTLAHRGRPHPGRGRKEERREEESVDRGARAFSLSHGHSRRTLPPLLVSLGVSVLCVRSRRGHFHFPLCWSRLGKAASERLTHRHSTLHSWRPPPSSSSHSNAGGGGERVLWAAVACLQREEPDVICLVYTGDIDASRQEIVDKVKVGVRGLVGVGQDYPRR